MALSAYAGAFNVGTGAATTTVAVTGVGFTPKAVIFWWSGRTESTDTVGGANIQAGAGFAAGATQRCCCSNYEADAAAAADSAFRAANDACIGEVATNGTWSGKADLQSFDADGFTIIIDDQFVASQRISYLALGGTTITNAYVGQYQFAQASAANDEAVTGVGFQPDCVVMYSHTANAGDAGGGDDLKWGLGATSGVGHDIVVMNFSNGGSDPTDTKRYGSGAECTAFPSVSGGAIGGRSVLKSFDADGFTLDIADTQAGAHIGFLALKGGAYHVGDFVTRTDTNDIAVTGVGFQPSGVLFISHGTTESTADTFQDHAMMSIGAASGATTRTAQAYSSEDNLADSEAATALETDAVYIHLDLADAIDGLMDVKSFDADGFTCVMDDADPGAAFVGYVAFGTGTAPAATSDLRTMPRGLLRGMNRGMI